MQYYLMNDRIIRRIKSFFENIDIKTDSPDKVIIMNSVEPFIDQTFFYFTGLSSGLFEGCSVIFDQNHNVKLFTSKLEEQTAIANSSVEIVPYEDYKSYLSLLQREIKPNETIGFNSSGLTVNTFNNMKKTFPENEFIDVSRSVLLTRTLKDQQEINLIKKSADIAGQAYNSILDSIETNTTEEQLSSLLNYKMEYYGASNPSFETIIAFGDNSAEPHYAPQKTKLSKNSIVLTDFGAKYKKYCSDITRTIFYGKANNEFKEMYKVVLEAHKIGCENLIEGNLANEVHNKVANYIDSTKYRGRFIHSTGHSLGLSVHDGASISSNSNLKLKEGMVFTIEPGIYIPKFGGIRIEDDLVVGKNKPEILSSLDRNLTELN